MNLILDFERPTYIPPLGTPLYWRDESSGKLKKAIEQYCYWAAGESDRKPDLSQFHLIKGYFRYWINAPCWKGNIAELNKQLESIETVEELEPWLNNCLVEGIDPL